MSYHGQQRAVNVTAVIKVTSESLYRKLGQGIERPLSQDEWFAWGYTAGEFKHSGGSNSDQPNKYPSSCFRNGKLKGAVNGQLLLGMANRTTVPLQRTLVKGQQAHEAKRMFMPNGTKVLGDQQRGAIG